MIQFTNLQELIDKLESLKDKGISPKTPILLAMDYKNSVIIDKLNVLSVGSFFNSNEIIILISNIDRNFSDTINHKSLEIAQYTAECIAQDELP